MKATRGVLLQRFYNSQVNRMIHVFDESKDRKVKKKPMTTFIIAMRRTFRNGHGYTKDQQITIFESYIRNIHLGV